MENQGSRSTQVNRKLAFAISGHKMESQRVPDRTAMVTVQSLECPRSPQLPVPRAGARSCSMIPSSLSHRQGRGDTPQPPSSPSLSPPAPCPTGRGEETPRSPPPGATLGTHAPMPAPRASSAFDAVI